jgi:cytochrome c peroxidase
MHVAAAAADHALTMQSWPQDSVFAAATQCARRGALVTIALAFSFMTGCSGEAGSDSQSSAPHGSAGTTGRNAGPRMPWVYAPLGLAPEPATNPSTPEKVHLGRLLFHDPILSGDNATACVTCHSQYWGMGDGLAFGIGVGGAGPSGIGRRGPTKTRRNVPTLWNVAYRTALFWDGRVSSLEEQIEVPLLDDRELGGNPEVVMRKLAENATYQGLFAAAFPESPQPSRENLARAIASFVRTIVSSDAPYDRYARGDDKALSELEIRGMFLFAELGCATCHAPPLFGVDAYSAVGLTNEAFRPSALSEDDFGRFEITGDESDRYAFRVPQLRNVRETGPYFHDGRAATMSQALREMTAATSSRPVSEDELVMLGEFVGKGLMDKARVPERPLSVPSGLPVPSDGFTIRR